MTSTVTAGELKIIEANVNGLGNKEKCIKEFLQRRKKKADIFCIVEHKTNDSNKLLRYFATGSYKVRAFDCRRTGGPGGGVALLVHERLTHVENVEAMFQEIFDVARSKGIDIAGVKLNLKPKDCRNVLFVFGIYKRPRDKLSDLIRVIHCLINTVNKNYGGTAVFTGDFNFDNSKEGQKTRSMTKHKELMPLDALNYKATHVTPSHSQGKALNNFFVPKVMKYTPKTIKEGLILSFAKTYPKHQKLEKDSDHIPLQIIITLENTGRQQQGISTRAATAQQERQGNSTFDVNAPSTSAAHVHVHRSWIEGEDGVITILDDSSDDEETDNSSHQEQPVAISNEVTLTRIKIEGEPRSSGAVESRPANTTSTILSQSSCNLPHTSAQENFTPTTTGDFQHEQTVRPSTGTSGLPHVQGATARSLHEIQLERIAREEELTRQRLKCTRQEHECILKLTELSRERATIEAAELRNTRNE